MPLVRLLATSLPRSLCTFWVAPNTIKHRDVKYSKQNLVSAISTRFCNFHSVFMYKFWSEMMSKKQMILQNQWKVLYSYCFQNQIRFWTWVYPTGSNHQFRLKCDLIAPPTNAIELSPDTEEKRVSCLKRRFPWSAPYHIN